MSEVVSKRRLKRILTIYLVVWSSAFIYFIYYTITKPVFADNDYDGFNNAAVEDKDMDVIETPLDAIAYPKPAATVNINDFDHESYLKKRALKIQEDSYVANNLNRAVIDALKSNRNIDEPREMD